MHQLLFLLLIAVLFSNCALLNSSSSEESAKELGYQHEGEKSNSEQSSIESEEPSFELQASREAHSQQSCEGCIVGSSSSQSLQQAEKKVYFLYGAEELELSNYYFDIPVVYNAATKKWIRYFMSRGKEYFVRYSERAGRYAPVLSKVLEQHGLPRDLIFLAMAESGFQNTAKSWAKAVGPWQFMPYTGKKYGLEIDWYVDERRDPIKAAVAASKYLQDLYERFGKWELAMAGYNAGEGKVARAIRRYRTKDFWKMRRFRYLKRETKEYVPKIMALAIIGKNLESFGLGDIEFQKPLDFEEIDLGPNTDLYAVAEALKVDFEVIQKFNPEIRRWMTPPTRKSYNLRVPVGLKKKWDGCCSGPDTNIQLMAATHQFQKYSMRSRSSLRAVAKKFRLPVNVLAELNNASAHKRFSPGTEINLPFRLNQSRRAKMYADLYELPSRRVRRKRRYSRRIRLAMKRGNTIQNPSVYYTVKKGDSLWTVSRKTGVSLDTLIKSNVSLVKKRMIKPGDKLAIR